MHYIPHEVDTCLLECVKNILGHLKKNNPQRTTLQNLVKEYTRACILNKGKDLSRSKHWNTLAYMAHDKLRKLEVDIHVAESI